jgi:two-component system sensor histidine kinase/response regulator
MNYINQVIPNSTSYSSNPLNGNKAKLPKLELATAEQTMEISFRSRINELNEYIERLEAMAEERENEIAQIVSTKNKFIAIIAHDLRGPFSSIMCALELLKLKLTHSNIKAAKKYVDIATDSANKTLHLLDDLLIWTISQSRISNFKPIMINFQELINCELKGFRFASMQKRITLSRKIPDNLMIKADIQMIRTVVRNLLSNAIKFTPNDGIVTVGASENSLDIQISVKDSGIGISAIDRRNLFNAEKHHSTPGTNNETGVGLGLILCKEFVELHGGRIWIEKPGAIGSEFKFTLPKTRNNNTEKQIVQNN